MMPRPTFSFRHRLMTAGLVAALAGELIAFAAPNQPAASPVHTKTNTVAAAAKPATRVLDENAVTKLLTAKLQKDYVGSKGKLELQLTQPWKAPTVPNEPLTVKILELPTAGVTPSFIIRFQLCDRDKSLGVWQSSVRAHVWRNVWIAKSDLRRGTLIANADITSERRDVLPLHASLARISAHDTSSELAQSVPAGTILLGRMLRPRTLIHRGQIANALVEDGGMSITTKVEALEDGAAGQIIHIRNVASRRDLTGKVINNDTVSISL